MTTDEHRAFNNRSERRCLGALIAALAACNLLVLGPCNVGEWLYDDSMSSTTPLRIMPQIESQMKYGDSIYWNGAIEPPSCWVQYLQCAE